LTVNHQCAFFNLVFFALFFAMISTSSAFAMSKSFDFVP